MSDMCVLRLSFLYLAVVVSASEATGQFITATLGQDVTLPCQARNYRPFEVVEWSRPGKHSEYVLVFDQKASDLEIPEQNYKDRVGLVDMENGDASLKLRNVTAEDEGTYECYVVREAKRRKRHIQPICIVNLVVASPPPPSPPPPPPPPGRGHIGLIVAAVLFAAVVFTLPVVIWASLFVWNKKKNLSPPHDEAV